MELPVKLRQAVEQTLLGQSMTTLGAHARTLSARYRAEIRDGRRHIAHDEAALAYLTTRLPATYAAVRAAIAQIEHVVPDFRPATLLDVGAGPATVGWAAMDAWLSLKATTLVEASPAIRRLGERLGQAADIPLTYVAADLEGPLQDLVPADLVTMAYVLDELTPKALPALLDRLWDLTRHVLLVVEPGTPAGWQRLMAIRAQLLARGAFMLAPCPHDAPCPLRAPDWCHFARRVARSRAHRQAKGGDVPWEDEKFSYLALAREPVALMHARVVAPPRLAKHRIGLKLCEPGGSIRTCDIGKRDKAAYQAARRVGWGELLPPT